MRFEDKKPFEHIESNHVAIESDAKRCDCVVVLSNSGALNSCAGSKGSHILLLARFFGSGRDSFSGDVASHYY